MRCQRAQKWMTAAVDGELSARRRRALDGHLAACAASAASCGDGADAHALAGLPMEAAVSAGLEQPPCAASAAAADEAERAPQPLGALAAAAGVRPRHGRVLVLAIGIVRRTARSERARGPGAQGRCRGVAQAPPRCCARRAASRRRPRGAARQARPRRGLFRHAIIAPGTR